MPPKNSLEQISDKTKILYNRIQTQLLTKDHVLLDGPDVRLLLDVFDIANGKLNRAVKKTRRSKIIFSEEAWGMLASYECLEKTGFTKQEVELLADSLTVIDVHKAVGHRIDRREALSLTLAKFHRPNMSYTSLETQLGRPASVISKVVNHVVRVVVEHYDTLLSIGQNPILTEERIKGYSHALRIRPISETDDSESELSERSKDKDTNGNDSNSHQISQSTPISSPNPGSRRRPFSSSESESNSELDSDSESDQTSNETTGRKRKLNSKDKGKFKSKTQKNSTNDETQKSSSKNLELSNNEETDKSTLNYIDEKRNRVFAAMANSKISIKVPKEENRESFYDFELGNTTMKFVLVVSPDNMIIGVIGKAPGRLNLTQVLEQKRTESELSRYTFSNSKDPTNNLNEKVPYYVYGGWKFENADKNPQLDHVLTIKELSRENCKDKEAEAKLLSNFTSIIISSDSAGSSSVSRHLGFGYQSKYSCTKCNYRFLVNLDDDNVWRRLDFNEFGVLNDLRHWLKEKTKLDEIQSPGEDDVIWCMRDSAQILQDEFVETFGFFRISNSNVDFSKMNIEDMFKFCILVYNFRTCITGATTKFGMVPPSLKRYLQTATSNNSDSNDSLNPNEEHGFGDKEHTNEEKQSKEYIKEWGGILEPDRFNPAEISPVSTLCRNSAFGLRRFRLIDGTEVARPSCNVYTMPLNQFLNQEHNATENQSSNGFNSEGTSPSSSSSESDSSEGSSEEDDSRFQLLSAIFRSDPSESEGSEFDYY